MRPSNARHDQVLIVYLTPYFPGSERTLIMYERHPPSEPISQGDIIDDCPIFGHDASEDPDALPLRWLVRVVVLTQACDLAQEKATRVLVGHVQSAQHLIDRGILKVPLIRDQIRRGLVYGWYFLPAAPPPVDLPESIVDLRDLHTVTKAILNRLIAEGNRICRIQTPYREHLAQHFAVTYSRIGLPEPYGTQP